MNGVSARIFMRLPGRNALAALLLIGTVLLGTLTVHSMMNSSDMSASAMSSDVTGAPLSSGPDILTVAAYGPALFAAEGVSTAASSIAPTLLAACPGSCATDPLMANVICAIAILAVFLAVRLMRPSIRRAMFTQLRHRAAIAASRIPLPRPPSLFVLSISRT